MQNGLTKEESLEIYRKLILARACEEKIQEEYFKDEMKTPVHLGIGGEAIAVGVCHCFPKNTKTFGTYRNHSMYLSITEDTDAFFGELYGKLHGAAKGKAGSMHLCAPQKGFMATSAVVGTTIPLAVGAALANAYRKSNDLVAVFFGDGAMEEGVFWESINFAALKRLKILFVCEDNGLAIHTAKEERQAFSSVTKICEQFHLHVGENDGSDVVQVLQATRKVLNQMDQKPGPGLLHFNYYRFLEHVGPKEDFGAGYRPKLSAGAHEDLDPVLKFEKLLCQNGTTALELKKIKSEVGEKIDQSVLKARQLDFPSAEELFTDVYS